MSSVAQGRLCILSKLVHASERQWCRLVIPGAVLKLWQAMQRVRPKWRLVDVGRCWSAAAAGRRDWAVGAGRRRR